MDWIALMFTFNYINFLLFLFNFKVRCISEGRDLLLLVSSLHLALHNNHHVMAEQEAGGVT